jgi:hypothetical protein
VRRRRAAAATACVVAITSLLVGCSGDSDRSANVSPPTTGGDGGTSSTVPGHGGDPGLTVPEGADAPALSGVTAAPTLSSCTGPTIPVAVTFAAAATPPVRWFTVFVEGDQAGISPVQGSLTVDVPCDGVAHTLLVIATGENGASSTESVAVRTPSPS